jgi:hypothetical protein
VTWSLKKICFTRVQMVGPCGDGLRCLSMDVDQRLLGGFRNLWLSGGKTYNLGTPDDRWEISPSQKETHDCVYALSGLRPV